MTMNLTELELIRQQSDGPTIIMMFLTMCVFAIGILLGEIK